MKNDNLQTALMYLICSNSNDGIFVGDLNQLSSSLDCTSQLTSEALKNFEDDGSLKLQWKEDVFLCEIMC